MTLSCFQKCFVRWCTTAFRPNGTALIIDVVVHVVVIVEIYIIVVIVEILVDLLEWPSPVTVRTMFDCFMLRVIIPVSFPLLPNRSSSLEPLPTIIRIISRWSEQI